MDKSIKSIAVLILLFSITSCVAPAKSVFTPWTSSLPVQLTTGESNRNHIELGIIWAIGISFADIHEELQKKAQEINANAVIRITYQPHTRTAVGTAIRYADSSATTHKK